MSGFCPAPTAFLQGYRSGVPDLTVRNAERAMEFYEETFGARGILTIHG